jgi:hypothetical protein
VLQFDVVMTVSCRRETLRLVLVHMTLVHIKLRQVYF